MKDLKKLVSNDYDLFIDLAAAYGFNSVTGLLHSDLVIYHDRTLNGLMCGVGMDQKEFYNMLLCGADSKGYSGWSLYYLKRHDQYILIDIFY